MMIDNTTLLLSLLLSLFRHVELTFHALLISVYDSGHVLMPIELEHASLDTVTKGAAHQVFRVFPCCFLKHGSALYRDTFFASSRSSSMWPRTLIRNIPGYVG